MMGRLVTFDRRRDHIREGNHFGTDLEDLGHRGTGLTSRLLRPLFLYECVKASGIGTDAKDEISVGMLCGKNEIRQAAGIVFDPSRGCAEMMPNQQPGVAFE